MPGLRVDLLPAPLQASAPNQLWSRDATYLATTVKGVFCCLCLILELFSRKLVGREVYESESAEHAAEVFTKVHLRERVAPDTLTLHSDNGSPMNGAAILATLRWLGGSPPPRLDASGHRVSQPRRADQQGNRYR